MPCLSAHTGAGRPRTYLHQKPRQNKLRALKPHRSQAQPPSRRNRATPTYHLHHRCHLGETYTSIHPSSHRFINPSTGEESLENLWSRGLIEGLQAQFGSDRPTTQPATRTWCRKLRLNGIRSWCMSSVPCVLPSPPMNGGAKGTEDSPPSLPSFLPK